MNEYIALDLEKLRGERLMSSAEVAICSVDAMFFNLRSSDENYKIMQLSMGLNLAYNGGLQDP